MPTPKKKPVNKAPVSEEIEPALDEMDEDADIDPDELVDDDKEDDDATPAEQLSVEEEEGEDPVARAKNGEEEEEEKKPAEEEVGDGLEDEDGIKALNRAEKELHEMEFGSGGDAEEPEEEMI